MKLQFTAREVEDKFKAIVLEHLGVDEDEVTASAKFEEDLQADSLDMVEMVISLEEEFGVEINDDEIKPIKTIGDGIELVKRKIPSLA